MKSDLHICTVKAEKYVLPKLSPNAPARRKFLRCLKTYVIPDPKNIQSRQLFRSRTLVRLEQERQIKSGYTYIIHPCSKINFIKEIFMCVLWILVFFDMPFQLAFFPFSDSVAGKIIRIMETLYNIFLIMFIFINFISGYIIADTREIVLQPKMIRKHYLKTYFIADFCGIIPFILANLEFLPNVYRQYMGLVEFILFARIHTLHEYLYHISRSLGFNEVLRICIGHFFYSSMILNFWTCMIWLVPRWKYMHTGKYHDKSWIINAKLLDTSIYNKYVTCLSVCFCNFIGASPGMFHIYNVADEETVLVLVSLSGFLYVLYIIAELLHILQIFNYSESKYEQMRHQLEDYMMSKKLSKTLKCRLRKYYEFSFRTNFLKESTLKALLSEHLQQEIFLHTCRSLLEKVDIFKMIPKSAIGVIIGMLKPEIFLTNDVLGTAGDPIHKVYFIAFGTVALYRNDIEVTHLEDGDQYGLISLFSSESSSYLFTAIATEISEIYSLRKIDLNQYLKRNPELGQVLQKRLKDKEHYLEESTRDTLEEATDQNDLVSRLRSGHILERRRKRRIHVVH